MGVKVRVCSTLVMLGALGALYLAQVQCLWEGPSPVSSELGSCCCGDCRFCVLWHKVLDLHVPVGIGGCPFWCH